MAEPIPTRIVKPSPPSLPTLSHCAFDRPQVQAMLLQHCHNRNVLLVIDSVDEVSWDEDYLQVKPINFYKYLSMSTDIHVDDSIGEVTEDRGSPLGQNQTNLPACPYVCAYTCVRARVCVRTRVFTRARAPACKRACVCTCVHADVPSYIARTRMLSADYASRDRCQHAARAPVGAARPYTAQLGPCCQ